MKILLLFYSIMVERENDHRHRRVAVVAGLSNIVVSRYLVFQLQGPNQAF